MGGRGVMVGEEIVMGGKNLDVDRGKWWPRGGGEVMVVVKEVIPCGSF